MNLGISLLAKKNLVTCPRINLNKKYLLQIQRGAWGSLFSSTTQKTPEPVTAPKEDNAWWTGTRNARRCGYIVRGAASEYAKLWCPSTLLRTVSLSNGRSTTSG